MKKIAFAVLVFGTLALFPFYLVVELGRGTDREIPGIMDPNFGEDNLPVLFFSVRKDPASVPDQNHPENNTATGRKGLFRERANSRHNQFDN